MMLHKRTGEFNSWKKELLTGVVTNDLGLLYVPVIT